MPKHLLEFAADRRQSVRQIQQPLCVLRHVHPPSDAVVPKADITSLMVSTTLSRIFVDEVDLHRTLSDSIELLTKRPFQQIGNVGEPGRKRLGFESVVIGSINITDSSLRLEVRFPRECIKGLENEISITDEERSIAADQPTASCKILEIQHGNPPNNL